VVPGNRHCEADHAMHGARRGTIGLCIELHGYSRSTGILFGKTERVSGTFFVVRARVMIRRNEFGGFRLLLSIIQNDCTLGKGVS